MIYVCSDIHGNIEKYKKLLERINLQLEDKLYVLGDVIDRGSHSIEILLDIMQRENIIFLAGNHEYMMYNAITKVLREKTDDSPLDEENPFISLWFLNGGRVTLSKFLEQSKDIQNDIIDFIGNSYVAIPYLKVGDKAFYLVHACPHMGYLDEPVTLREAEARNSRVLEALVWERLADIFWNEIDAVRLSDRKAVVGHTITSYFCFYNQNEFGICRIHHDKYFIGIDCGCSRGDSTACLACLRLDDMKEFYV